eukprot:1289403-Amphidinium_carterae.1
MLKKLGNVVLQTSTNGFEVMPRSGILPFFMTMAMLSALTKLRKLNSMLGTRSCNRAMLPFTTKPLANLPGEPVICVKSLLIALLEKREEWIDGALESFVSFRRLPSMT